VIDDCKPIAGSIMLCDMPAIMICADLSMSLKSAHSDRNLKFIFMIDGHLIDDWKPIAFAIGL
jgi:hypothetical protein